MNRYEEESEIVAICTKHVDAKGRINGLTEHRGKTARVLILLRDPALDMPERRRVV